jgi:hypothetical protein
MLKRGPKKEAGSKSQKPLRQPRPTPPAGQNRTRQTPAAAYSQPASSRFLSQGQMSHESGFLLLRAVEKVRSRASREAAGDCAPRLALHPPDLGVPQRPHVVEERRVKGNANSFLSSQAALRPFPRLLRRTDRGICLQALAPFRGRGLRRTDTCSGIHGGPARIRYSDRSS